MLRTYVDGDLEFLAVVRELVMAPKPIARYYLCAGELCEYAVMDRQTGKLVLEADDINLVLDTVADLNQVQVA